MSIPQTGEPDDFLIIGCQPASLDMGLELSAEVEKGLERALGDVVDVLQNWGYAIVATGQRAP